MWLLRRRLKGIRGYIFISLLGFIPICIVALLKSRSLFTNVESGQVMRDVTLSEILSGRTAKVIRVFHKSEKGQIDERKSGSSRSGSNVTTSLTNNSTIPLESELTQIALRYNNMSGNSSTRFPPLTKLDTNHSYGCGCGPDADENRKPTEIRENISDTGKLKMVSSLMLHPPENITRYMTPRKQSLNSKHITQLNEPIPCVNIGVYAGPNGGRWKGGYVCPETECYVRVIQSLYYPYLKDTHALYIPQSSLPQVDFKDMKRFRPANQVWIFNSFESPVHTHPLDSKWARHGFNWTFTYRTDSTFPSPYGRYIPGRPLIAENDTTNWAGNKTKFAAWIGSNCHNTQWPRLDFVRKLQKFIPLDTFGTCGTKHCPKNTKCGEILLQYKFYFALENSHCTEYITEKFWRAPFKNNMIPVVYGPSRDDYAKVAPPKSFIHVDEFDTIAELANYLKILDKNNTLYNEYFEWKRRGSVQMDLIGQYYISRKVMCPIAGRIKARRAAGNNTSDTLDMAKWWTNSCREETITRMLDN